MLKRVLILIWVFCVSVSAQAHDSIPGGSRFQSFIGIDLTPSYAWHSYRDDILGDNLNLDYMKETKISTSMQLKYGFLFPSDSWQGRFFPGVWQGVGAGINYFGNPRSIGVPVSVFAFQGAPILKVKNNLSLFYEWNFGASFGWKPCDGEIAYSSLIVGSKINAYINIGIGLQLQLGKNYALRAGVDLTHFSNGNTSYPNPGVNTMGVRFGLTRAFGREAKYAAAGIGEVYEDSLWKKRRLGFDLTFYGAWRKRVYRGGEIPVLLNGHFGIAGFDFASMWRVKRFLRVGASLDFQWDESTDLRRHHISGSTSDDILFSRPPFFNQVCVGLSARAELVMPVFSLNVGCGCNILGPEETRATYQLANLKVFLSKGLFLNIGYQLLNFQKQNNLMLGFGYSFQ